MRTAYLHIGLHKTGTTAIQRFLFTNQKALQQEGWLFPVSGTNQWKGGQHNLAGILAENHQYDPRYGNWEDLTRELKSIDHQDLVISAEQFFPLSPFPEKIKFIKNYFSEYKVKIILYVRPQWELIEKKYCQQVKSGSQIYSFETYRQQWIQKKGYDWYQQLQPWKEIFGQENILVCHYKPNDLINHFLDRINYPETKRDNLVYETKRHNLTPSIKVIKVCFLLNKITRNWLKLPNNERNTIYLKRLKNNESLTVKLINSLPNFIIDDKLASDELQENMRQLCEPINQKIAQEYLGQVDGKLFD